MPGDMVLPKRFEAIHTDGVFSCWIKDRPDLVRIIPREPLGPPLQSPESVTIVTVRCWNDHGAMRFEAASSVDLEAARAWETQYAKVTDEDLDWLPTTLGVGGTK